MDKSKIIKIAIACIAVILVYFIFNSLSDLTAIVIAILAMVFISKRYSQKRSDKIEPKEMYDLPIGPSELPEQKKVRFMAEYSEKIDRFFEEQPSVIRWWGDSLSCITVLVKRSQMNVELTGHFEVSDDGELTSFEQHYGPRGVDHFTLFESKDITNRRIAKFEENKTALKNSLLVSEPAMDCLELARKELDETGKCSLHLRSVIISDENLYERFGAGSALWVAALSDLLGDNVKVSMFSEGTFKASKPLTVHLSKAYAGNLRDIQGYIETSKENVANGATDPALSIMFKSGEIILKLLSKEAGLPYDSREVDFVDMIDALYVENIISEDQKHMLHAVRAYGNLGKHEDIDNTVSHDEKMEKAENSVKIMEKLLKDFS